MSDFWLDSSSTPIHRVPPAKALHECAGLPEPSLVTYVISTIISWAGSDIKFYWISFNFRPSETMPEPTDSATQCEDRTQCYTPTTYVGCSAGPVCSRTTCCWVTGPSHVRYQWNAHSRTKIAAKRQGKPEGELVIYWATRERESASYQKLPVKYPSAILRNAPARFGRDSCIRIDHDCA